MRTIVLFTIVACRSAETAVQDDGGPAPVICTRKNTLDLCRDASGAFWVCDGIKPARCVRANDAADTFAIKPAERAP